MPSSFSAPVPANTSSIRQEEESTELAIFRQEWLLELERRKAEPHGSTSGNTSGSNVGVTDKSTSGETTPTPQSPKGKTFIRSTSTQSKEPASTRSFPPNHPALSDGGVLHEPNMPPKLAKALKLYRRAVENEQKGDLDEAVDLYRLAFREDDKVDRAYTREQMLKSILKDREESSSKKTVVVKPEEVEDLSASFQSAVTVKPAAASAIITGTLATLLKGFPVDLKFEPENEKEPIFLNTLPEELLVLVISKLDPTSIERFASVSRRARVLSLDPGIWRDLVRATYKPPQIPDLELLTPVVERVLFDYRRVYVEQPRVRLDGVYIAICHYVRPGLSENHWVNISHLITYHRYLRFFPNGQVLSLLANEEKNPQEVIPILKPTLRMKGLFLGNWKLVGTTVHLSTLIDASGRFALPLPTSSEVVSGGSVEGMSMNQDYSHGLAGTALSGSHGHGHGHGHSFSLHGHGHGHGHSSISAPDRARYVFDMTLNLRSRPLGRWNRMDIQSYDSVNLETGDIHPVALKHERPFWFSKVRSYA